MKQFSFNDLLNKVSAFKDNAKVIMCVAAFIFLLDGFIIVRAQIIPLVRFWKKAAQTKADILEARSDFKSFDSFKKKLADLRVEVDGLHKKTILQEELPKVLESISKSADMSVVKILKIRPMAEIKTVDKPVKIGAGNELTRHKISISAIAGFHQLGRFVALLENSGYFHEIRKLEIRSDSQGYMKHSITIFLDVMVRKS